MSLKRLAAFYVLSLSLASMLVMWLAFEEMLRTGEPTIRIVANRYGEFKLEAALYALGMMLLPVALYEADEIFRRE